ncbi:protein YLS7-like [Trifolium pratense]|uniref:Protein YLS7-like n=1 Tax=Trifolium pratense TaxID=57577 RepID=A0A2K3MYX0_TRIPR|nr:protein YLS7-like [Trifolium pratense]
MERQKSFSFKPTRLLLFTFTIFSSIFFLSTFTIWLTKSTTTPSLHHQQTLLNFNTSTNNNNNSVELNLQPLTVLSLTQNFSVTKIQTLIDNRLSRSQKSFSESKSEDIEIEENHVVDTSISSVNFTAMHGNNGTKVEASGLVDKSDKVLIFKEIEVKKKKKIVKECDLRKGYWVFDESYPLYSRDSCPFIDEGFDCEGNGRLDRNYTKWRWQPQDCDLPRFNATKMLELIRGKRLVFVGDSINRNQWESMLCMLLSAVKDPKRVYEARGRKITKEKGNYSFRFLDYQCTVEYYVSHFLVHESKARVGQKRRPTLRIDAIDHGSSRWRGADILIFNTAHWWSHYKTKAGTYYFQEGTLVHPRLNVSTAFTKALTTWASWVDKRINLKKTQVFFRSSAPSHFRFASDIHCAIIYCRFQKLKCYCNNNLSG